MYFPFCEVLFISFTNFSAGLLEFFPIDLKEHFLIFIFY